MKTANAVALFGVVCISITGCAQSLRGDADQVYVYSAFALLDTQSIDEASKHCSKFGKIAVYRGQYSEDTKLFSCIIPSKDAELLSKQPDKNYNNDIDKLHQSADRGDVDAMFRLGALYSQKRGTLSPDYAQSMLWLHRAADLGDSNSMTLIGGSYIKGENGVAADPKEAMRWLLKAAELNNASAMYALGMMLKEGVGVASNKIAAMNWFLKSARLGFVDAMPMVGLDYINGVDGGKPNYIEAMRWFRSAADAGNARSMFVVGILYRNGGGVVIDYAEAMRWFLKSAQLGFGLAMKQIGQQLVGIRWRRHILDTPRRSFLPGAAVHSQEIHAP